jgi:uncharacterized damage-inducible protein DinB
MLQKEPFMSEHSLEKLFKHNNWANRKIINHATEHREQIKSMLSALGVTPPDIDSWDFGEFSGALVPVQDAGKI